MLLIEREYLIEDADVDGDGRTVLVRAVPYGVPALVADGVDDRARGLATRQYREGWEHGAFRRAVRAPHRVPFVVGRHSDRRTNPYADVGRARVLEERADGLYASLLVDRSGFGDHALEKITSGQWRGVSVGAAALGHRDEGDPHAGGVRWRTRAALDHILLTEHPAYVGAEVLAVREETAAPLLAAWRAKYPPRVAGIC